jgi:hypothetical protein
VIEEDAEVELALALALALALVSSREEEGCQEVMAMMASSPALLLCDFDRTHQAEGLVSLLLLW